MIFLQTGECRQLSKLADLANREPLHILGYVHDSAYALAASLRDLKDAFKRIAHAMYAENKILLALKTADGVTIDSFDPGVVASQKRKPESLAQSTRAGESVQCKKRTVVVTMPIVDLEADDDPVHTCSVSSFADPYPVNTESLELLANLHARARNCVPW